MQLKSGIPTISVEDIAIQEREEDLVLATFGRGFYILDDYSTLRTVDEKFMKKKGTISRKRCTSYTFKTEADMDKGQHILKQKTLSLEQHLLIT